MTITVETIMTITVGDNYDNHRGDNYDNHHGDNYDNHHGDNYDNHHGDNYDNHPAEDKHQCAQNGDDNQCGDFKSAVIQLNDTKYLVKIINQTNSSNSSN